MGLIVKIFDRKGLGKQIGTLEIMVNLVEENHVRTGMTIRGGLHGCRT